MEIPRKKARYLAVGFALLLAIVGLSACGSSSSSSSGSSSGSSGGSSGGEKYDITLDINGTFNGWRTQMQHTVEFAAENAPLSEKVNFNFVASPEALSGQANDLNNIIASHPDAILIDAASATGLNAQVTKACAAGILVVSFDNVVTSPCAYKLTTNIKEEGELVATHLAEKLGGKGEVVIDKAFPGAEIADELFSGFETAVGKFPEMKVVGTFESKWEPGRVKSELGSLLAAHPNISAVLLDLYDEQVVQAFEEAKLPPVAIGTGTVTNGDIETCERTKIECASSTHPPYLGAEALKLATALLDGEADTSEKEVFIQTPYLFTNPVKEVPGFEGATIEKAKSISGLTKEAVLPVVPPWLDITPQEATGT